MSLPVRALSVCIAAFLLAAAGSAQVPARSATLRRIAEHGYLGVGVIELTDDRVKALGLRDDSGVEVVLVEVNSAASKAGLKVNDVILGVNGRATANLEQFYRSISEAPGGVRIGLTVWRGGAKRTVAATLESRQDKPFFDLPDAPMPSMPAYPPGVPWDGNTPPSGPTGSGAVIGFDAETLSPQLAEFFGVKDGVLVRTVGPKTPAERAGLKAGDVVIRVNGTPVSTPREIAGLVRMNRSKTTSFTVVRNKKEISLNVEISAVRAPVSMPGGVEGAVLARGLCGAVV